MATIFAYGQTGAGKSFSMLGPDITSDNRVCNNIMRCIRILRINFFRELFLELVKHYLIILNRIKMLLNFKLNVVFWRFIKKQFVIC